MDEEIEVQEQMELEEINFLFSIRSERILRARVDHMIRHSDFEFSKRFRLSKECCNHLLEEIGNLIKPPSQRNAAVSTSVRLLLTLRFFATGKMLLTISDFCGVSESAASVIIKLVSEAICTLRDRYIKMPTRREIQKVQRDFYNIARFPTVMGAIDCSHVRIQSPGGEVAENYRRKGYFSINVQTVSDSELKIMDIVTRWPGATHDQVIFNNSVLKARCEGGEFETALLLGDSGYQNTNYLLTPVNNPTTRAEELYNESHIRTRNVVERQYGVWKRRFPVLRLELRLAVSRIQAVVVATAILHNICIAMKEEIPPDDEDVIPDAILEYQQEIEAHGGILNGHRRAVMINYFNEL